MAQMGAWLIEVKAIVGHGHWEDEVKSWGTPSLSTCKRYMAVSRQPEEARQVKGLDGLARLNQLAKREVRKEKRDDLIQKAKTLLFPIATNHQVHHADNRRFRFPMVDHIFTDPRWKHLEDYEWLASMAKQKLKPGGYLVVQASPFEFPKISSMFDYFTYVWTFSIVYHATITAEGSIVNYWKPILVFSNGKAKLPADHFTDTFTITGKIDEKVYHEWQQPLAPFVRWISDLTQPGETICDPFSCTGTIALACKMTGRRCIATEIDGDMVAVARMRLAEYA